GEWRRPGDRRPERSEVVADHRRVAVLIAADYAAAGASTSPGSHDPRRPRPRPAEPPASPASPSEPLRIRPHMSSQPQLTGGAYLRLVVLGAAIGIPAAFVAAVFLAFVHDLERWLWHDLPDSLGYSSPPWFLVI